jgi:hypothetical protein
VPTLACVVIPQRANAALARRKILSVAMGVAFRFWASPTTSQVEWFNKVGEG